MKKFSPVPKETIQVLNAASETIIRDAVELSMQKSEEIKHHSEDPREIITQGFQFTHNMLIAAAQTGQPNLLEDQADWAVNRLPHNNIRMPFLINRLGYYRESLTSHLNDSQANAILPYLDFLISKIKKRFS